MCTDSQNVHGATVQYNTKSASMLLEIEKHLKIAMLQIQSNDCWFLFCSIEMKDWFDTHILYMMILQNFASIIVMNFYIC